MQTKYNDWYWVSEDGRLYSSARRKLVTEKDKSYLAWLAANPDYGPSSWPRDNDGNQTDVSLKALLADLGVVDAVPTINQRQIRLWLLGKGIVEDQVLKLINGLSDPDKSIASIEWEYADTFLHDHPFVQTLGQSIGLTPEDIEQGFREAAKL